MQLTPEQLLFKLCDAGSFLTLRTISGVLLPYLQLTRDKALEASDPEMLAAWAEMERRLSE